MRNSPHASSGLELARAKHALAAAGIDPDVELTRVSSVTNEVWLSDRYAIRVNRRLDKRLWREAKLAPVLPAAVHYPSVVAYGKGAGFDWLVTTRRPGRVLSRCWPELAPAQRRFAIRQLAFMLRALHETKAPSGLGSLDESGAPQLLRGGQDGSPVAALLDGLSRIATFPNVDADAIGEVRAYVRRRAEALDPFDAPTLIHGDLTFENVLWHDGEVTALIDFEWARAAPADLDLDVLLRFCAYPSLHVAADYAAETTAEAYDEVPSWLAEDYPRLFASRDLLDRLRIYAIAFEARQILAGPPEAPARDLPEAHPMNRLLRLLTRRSYLDQNPL